MATYAQIQEYLRRRHGCTVKTCWIAHVKELNGLPVRVAPNRLSADRRVDPCPASKRPLIEEAMRHFGML
jgi:hypothetical protein